eukprot:15335303-Ditylum_brightwellii.AAC.1
MSIVSVANVSQSETGQDVHHMSLCEWAISNAKAEIAFIDSTGKKGKNNISFNQPYRPCVKKY